MLLLDDRYQLAGLIGKGGVGEVYEGIQLALDRRVAIKLLRPELTARPDLVVRFEQEARTTCRLQHPNVVTVFDVGTAPNGGRFLVMELLEGRTLAAMLADTGPLPPDRVMTIATQIVRGMGAGQGVGLVHRDLKPENIFLVDDDRLVKILDFGLAFLQEGGGFAPTPTPSPPTPTPPPPVRGGSGRETMPPPGDTWNDFGLAASSAGATPTAAAPESSTPARAHNEGRLTNPGAVLGTPRYMSPEQAMGWSVDHRADLYAFGCILFEMLAGRPPFVARDSAAYLRLHVHAPPPPLRKLAPGTPRTFERLVMRLLEKDPNARFQDWAAVATELRRMRGSASVAHERLYEEAPQVRPQEPYRFLQPFSADSRAIFFGRDADARRFRAAWEHPQSPPIVVLSGRSGVGKSSFLHARIIAGLEDTGHVVVPIRGGNQPLRTLAGVVRRELARLEVQPPKGTPLPELLDTFSRERAQPVAVVLDQLEELFTVGGAEDQARFQADVAAMVASGDRTVRFVFSLREDYLGQLVRALSPLPVDELTRTFPLLPLKPEDLKEALEGPGREGLPTDYPPFTYALGLVDEIVRDLIEDTAGEVAPRVQVVGHRLWRLMQADGVNVITRDHYLDGLGGARGILGRVLDEAIGDVGSADQGIAKEMVRALTHLPGSATSSPQPESALCGGHADAERRRRVLRRLESPWRVIQGFTDPRFPEERSYRVAHESLIARIHEYGEENQPRNRARQVFRQGLALWLRNGKQERDLLPEEHFDIVLRHAEEMILRDADEQEFFEACRRLHDESWWRRYATERRQRTQVRVLMISVPTLCLILGLAMGQWPVNFTSAQVARVRAASWMGLEQLNLENADLRMGNLGGVSLRGVRLKAADLRHSDLRGAYLEGADMKRAALEGADLRGADLRGADLDDARLWGARFAGADLRKAKVGTWVPGADFTGAIFSVETDWGDQPPPPGALGPGARADYVALAEADLAGLDLYRAQMTGAVLRRAVLSRSVLSEADLTEIMASEASLDDAKMLKARLHRARLDGATLAQADLNGAELLGANLEGANLCGANLSNSRLDGAKLTGALADRLTRWPNHFNPTEAGVRVLDGSTPLQAAALSGASLALANLSELDLGGADLSDADLRQADLSDARLTEASLRGANLAGAKLDGADLCGADLREADLSAATFGGARSCPETRWSGPAPPGLLR
ncbi:MAG: pentapeptide repeat-containing protein [Alphaproteobacteria bacterium]|nr:pentapeptide repeat-containing protein [Alphaproteobacteria bacterium]